MFVARCAIVMPLVYLIITGAFDLHVFMFLHCIYEYYRLFEHPIGFFSPCKDLLVLNVHK